MKKTYPIQVDCAACANKMESVKIPGVEAVSISFMTQKITVTFDGNGNVQDVMRRLEKACRKIDSDCTIDF